MIIKTRITKEEINAMPKVEMGIPVTVISTVAEAETAVRYLMQYSVLGIDTETRPSFRRGENHKVALLQVSNQERCFLFRLNLIGLTLPIINLLESKRIIKVGLSLKDDFAMLRKRAPFSPNNVIELQEYVRPFGIRDMSLQKIYANLFAGKISKSQRLSNWEAPELTQPQQAYAGLDAWSCLLIYNKLNELKETGDFEILEVPEPNIQPQPNIATE